MNNKKVIVAVSTPQGIGALALIRLTGEGSFKVFKKCIEEKMLFKDEKEKIIRRYTIIDNVKNIVDDITAIKYEKPNTFTGEEMIEIICHGGNFVVKKIIKTICESGAKLAEKGEFTKRAYLNGKMNLIKAESINSIILSDNEMDHKTAIQFYRQKNETILQEIEEQIQQQIAKIEADIEFGEDEQNEVEDEDSKEIKKIIKKLQTELYIRKKVESNKNEKIVTIVGPTNAGKSSLYNEILGYERAIVSEIDGTTRDCISEIIEIQGIKCKLIDTAGMRLTDDEIEKTGQKNTYKTIQNAEIVIWITDISKKLNRIEIEEFEKHKNQTSIIIENKTDKRKNKEKEDYYRRYKKEIIPISIKEKKNIRKLIECLDGKIQNSQYNEIEPSIILNERHKTTVKEVMKNLKKATINWNKKEIAAEYLYYSLREIEKITGKRNQEEIINSIFDKFCIGK